VVFFEGCDAPTEMRGVFASLRMTGGVGGGVEPKNDKSKDKNKSKSKRKVVVFFEGCDAPDEMRGVLRFAQNDGVLVLSGLPCVTSAMNALACCHQPKPSYGLPLERTQSIERRFDTRRIPEPNAKICLTYSYIRIYFGNGTSGNNNGRLQRNSGAPTA